MARANPYDYPSPKDLHRITRLRLPILLCRQTSIPAPDSNRSKATEFVFNVTSDRKLTYSVSFFLPDSVAAGWAKSHGRQLSDSEQYAAVKMRLFRGFDELDMQADGRQLQIDLQALEESLASLGVE